jgi:RNA polymerase sigma factor (sigma-70 family)
VLVVEDDVLLGRALARLFRTAGHAVETFPSLESFWRFTLPETPACLVLDLHFPSGNGFEVLERLAVEGRPLPAVVVTAHGDVPTTVRAMKKGAVELLEKPFDNRQLLAAVEAALAQAARDHRERRARRALEERLAALTPREREVFHLVVEGLPNKRIAARLGIGEKTVKVHRARIMEKMAAASLPDLVRMASRVDPAEAR